MSGSGQYLPFQSKTCGGCCTAVSSTGDFVQPWVASVLTRTRSKAHSCPARWPIMPSCTTTAQPQEGSSRPQGCMKVSRMCTYRICDHRVGFWASQPWAQGGVPPRNTSRKYVQRRPPVTARHLRVCRRKRHKEIMHAAWKPRRTASREFRPGGRWQHLISYSPAVVMYRTHGSACGRGTYVFTSRRGLWCISVGTTASSP